MLILSVRYNTRLQADKRNSWQRVHPNTRELIRMIRERRNRVAEKLAITVRSPKFERHGSERTDHSAELILSHRGQGYHYPIDWWTESG